MKVFLSRAAFVLGIMVSAGASAATPPVPQISGSYILHISQICQAAANNLTTGGIGFVNTGYVSDTFGTVSVSPTAKTIKFSGFNDAGNIVYMPGGSTLTEASKSQTLTYSNTATTFTVGGSIYHAYYGSVTGNVAGLLEYSGIDTHGCIESGQAIRQ